MKTQAFTFIELIVYLALITLFLAALIPVTIQIIQSGTKTTTQNRLATEARFLTTRLSSEIRNSKGINAGTSTFDTNLATSPGSYVSLVEAAPNNPMLIDVANGRLRLTKGAAAAVEISSPQITVSNLTFSNYTNVNSSTRNLQFTLTLTDTGANQNYEGTITIETSVEINNY